jgi:2-amino-4-hydroxy-6-hydroxymethyldihydropteridine diphosphokinase
MPNICYLHLGSNLGNKEANLAKAVSLIDERLGVISLKSRLYLTEAWGVKNQDSFINQAIKLITPFDPDSVLEQTQMIEKEMGRERILKWGPRTIDIDILFYNDDVIENEYLVIPHPHMADRKFVLAPMNEIAGDLFHPVLTKSISKLFKECNDPSEVMELDNE